MDLPKPAPLFNALTSAVPLQPGELYAGPFGLIAFLPLIPVVLLLARRWPRAALVVGSLAWLVPTLRPATTGVVLAGLAAAWAWLAGLGALRRRGVLGERGMTALVWLGLHALVLPLWWHAPQPWYPARLAVLHNVGLAYFLLRFVAWGVELAKNPQQPARFLDTVCWLLYPPCMRLGPILLRDEFLRRLETWDPRRAPAWKEGLKRFGMFVLGGAGIGVIAPQIAPTYGDFFAQPENYSTGALVGRFYLIPIQIYLLLWTYNQLANALACWVGIHVDDNFHRLPLATSVRDFWHRWHITVGAWLRSYIYFPLGGGRRRATLNLIVVFAYCGLWHGPSWSFLAWGLAQAFALIVQRGWDWLWRRDLAADSRVDGSGGRCPPYGRSGRVWTVFCWLLTVQYEIATIFVFTDFDHLGLRLGRELLRRFGAAM